MVSLEKFCFDGDKKLELETLPTSVKGLGLDKEKIRDKTEDNRKEIAALQDKLYAEGKESLILILQAMDAAGKDSTIKHVMSSVDPQGLDVHSMKEPTNKELSHDFLWRTIVPVSYTHLSGMGIFFFDVFIWSCRLRFIFRPRH